MILAMNRLLLIILFAIASNSYAYDGFTSEVSHAAGGAVMAGAITKIFEDSPNRLLISVGASSTVSFLAESRQIFSKDAKVSSSLLDFSSHALGSVLGAWVTDSYLLTPIITRTYSGIALYRQF
jgi:uncharacterized membrane protein